MSVNRGFIAGGLALITGMALAAVVAQAQQALREGDGMWMKGQVSGTSPACSQAWHCNPAEPVGITDQETATFSADQATDGNCVKVEAGGACRVCEAPKPAVACKWQVFQKAS